MVLGLRPYEWSVVKRKRTSLVLSGTTRPPPVPTAIAFSPSAPSIFDNTTTGSFVSTLSVTMSDGSVFSGVLGFTSPNNNDGGLFALSAANLVTNSAMPTGNSTQLVTVSAAQNGTTISASLSIGVVAHGTGTVLTTFQLTSVQSGVAPFTVGVALRKGQSIGPLSTNVVSSQAVVMRRWNDNSVKHCIISGIAAFAQPNSSVTIQVIDQAGSGGASLTSANISSAAPTATVDFGDGHPVNLASLLASPIRTFVSGPNMVECHYQTIANNGAFVAFHVRLYSNGIMWVRAVVENGWVDLTNSDLSYIGTVTIGGIVVFTKDFTTNPKHYANSRWTAEGFIGGNPIVTPKHNMVDLVATKLVPNYFMDTPTAATLNTFPVQTYTPYQSTNWTPQMGDFGVQDQIGILPRWDALTITSLGDSRAFNATIANSKALGSYGIVWRGSSDSNLPLRPSIYPNFAIFGGTDSVGTGSLVWEVNHHSSGGYLAYILTGDYFHLETMQLQAATCWGCGNVGEYGAGTSKYLGRQVRGRAWMIRTISQMCGIAPSNDAMLADYQAVLLHTATVDTTLIATPSFTILGPVYGFDTGIGGGGWTENDGVSVIGSTAAWMQNFAAQAAGTASDCEPLSDANMVTWNTMRTWQYQWPIGLLGNGLAGNYCFNNAEAYGMQVAATNTDDLTQWFHDWPTIAALTTNKVPGFGACSNTLQGSSAGTPSGNLTLGAGVTGYWGNLLPAISYAVDHGAPGAAAAYNRLTGANNFSVLRNNTGGASGIPADFPQFCVQPRVSTTDALSALRSGMAVDTWKAAANTNMNAVAYSGPGAAGLGNAGVVPVMSTWCGAALDTNQEQLIVWGGGHLDYFGNEVYALKLSTLTWSELTQPDLGYPATYPGNGLLANGNPVGRHTYDNLTFLPTQNLFFACHGNDFQSNTDNHTWTLNPSTQNPNAIGAWVKRDDIPGSNVGGSGIFPGSSCAYDPTSGHVFFVGDDMFGLDEWNPSAGTGSQWTITNGNSQQLPAQQMKCAIKPGDRMIVTGLGFTVSIPISGINKGVFTTLTTTGDKTIENANAPGFVFHPPSGKFVGWNGGLTLYVFDSATNAWTVHAMTANTSPSTGFNTPTAVQPDGTYGRFFYDAAHDIFGAVNDVAQNVFFGRANIT